jgi:hypothetical protein
MGYFYNHKSFRVIKSDFLWLSFSIIFLMTITLTNELFDVSLHTFSVLILLDVFIILGLYISKRQFTFELFLTSLIILFIFSKFIAGVLESDPSFYNKTDLFTAVYISNDITKQIFLLYAILANILLTIFIILPLKRLTNSLDGKFNRDWLHSLDFVNNALIAVIFLCYLYVQFYYIVYIFDVGYLGVFDSSELWATSYRDLFSRLLYVNLSIAYILSVFLKKQKYKAILIVGIIFLILEILPGQRGHVILFILSILCWKSIVTNLRFKLLGGALLFVGSFFLMLILDLARGSTLGSGSILAYALNGFGMPLNLHQLSMHYQMELESYERVYSVYGIKEYFGRLFNFDNSVDFAVRSEELLSQTSYLGHKISAIVNYEAWLAGYGTGSAFLMELWLDFGYAIAIVILTIILFGYRLLANNIRLSTSLTPSLIYLTITPYFLFLPRGSLSNAFPSLVSVLIYWYMIIILVTIVNKLKFRFV